MSKRGKSNQEIRSSVMAEAERIVNLLPCKKLPIQLKYIARNRNILKVYFRPMLCDACLLTLSDGGFHVYVKAPSDLSEKLTNIYESNEEAELLPNRMRFSIAHEIAHTFFYESTENRDREVFKLKAGGSKTSIEIIEADCNILAGRILLPKELIKRELEIKETLCPEYLRDRCEVFGVSAATLAIRLSQLDLLRKELFKGAIIVARWTQKGFQAITKVIGASFRVDSIIDLRNRQPLIDLIPDNDFFINGGLKKITECMLPISTGKEIGIQKYFVQVENNVTEGNGRYIFLVLKAIEDESW